MYLFKNMKPDFVLQYYSSSEIAQSGGLNVMCFCLKAISKLLWRSSCSCSRFANAATAVHSTYRIALLIRYFRLWRKLQSIYFVSRLVSNWTRDVGCCCCCWCNFTRHDLSPISVDLKLRMLHDCCCIRERVSERERVRFDFVLHRSANSFFSTINSSTKCFVCVDMTVFCHFWCMRLNLWQ